MVGIAAVFTCDAEGCASRTAIMMPRGHPGGLEAAILVLGMLVSHGWRAVEGGDGRHLCPDHAVLVSSFEGEVAKA